MSDFRIAVIGDVHKAWDEEDVAYFNASAYDLLLFVGDLPGRSQSRKGLLSVAGLIGAVQKPLLLIPGNHDATTLRQFWGELTQDRGLIDKHSAGMEERVDELAATLGENRICGYSVHPQSKGDLKFDIIAGRPHTMGGDNPPGFLPYLQRRFQVDSMAASAALMKDLVDRSSAEQLFFLAHNGPTGLGSERTSIFGRDFKKEGGDWGDPDLAAALEYARSKKRVLGVVAGHMHHRCKGGGFRPWLLERDGTVFVNSARVPRVYKEGNATVHHHIELRLDRNGLRIFEVLQAGESEERKETVPGRA